MSAEHIDKALDIAYEFGQETDPAHKAWAIDQMVRALCGDDITYQMWVGYYNDNYNENGNWDEGTPP